MRWYDGLAIVVFALALMGAWMVMLVRKKHFPDHWFALTAALTPGIFYWVARSGASPELALAAAVFGGPTSAVLIIILPGRHNTFWRDEGNSEE